MKDEIIKKLNAVIAALDSIAVVGQSNRGNLYGSIETLIALLHDVDQLELRSAEDDQKP